MYLAAHLWHALFQVRPFGICHLTKCPNLCERVFFLSVTYVTTTIHGRDEEKRWAFVFLNTYIHTYIQFFSWSPVQNRKVLLAKGRFPFLLPCQDENVILKFNTSSWYFAPVATLQRPNERHRGIQMTCKTYPTIHWYSSALEDPHN